MVEIYRNPNRWKAVANKQEVNHGTAGALLSLILFAPLFIDLLGFGTIIVVVLIYVGVIVPTLTKYYSIIKYLLPIIRYIYNGGISITTWIQLCVGTSGKGLVDTISSGVSGFLKSIKNVFGFGISIVVVPISCLIFCGIPSLHKYYLRLNGIKTILNQVVFFALSDQLLIPKSSLTLGYFLKVYSILAYLHQNFVTPLYLQPNASHGRKLFELTVRTTIHAGFAMSVFVELFMKHHYNEVKPEITYLIISYLYFMITYKKLFGSEILISWIQKLNILECLEDDEEFKIPYFIGWLPVLSSGGVISLMIVQSPVLCLIAVYTNIVGPICQLHLEHRNYYQQRGNQLLRKYRRATTKELEGGLSCSVCLDVMSIGRVTPCNHIYHPSCLKRWREISNLCPLCKQNI